MTSKFIYFLFLLTFLYKYSYGQEDTVVIKDLTKVFFKTNDKSSVEPITSIKNINQVNFYLIGQSEEVFLRISNDNNLYLWKEDQMVKKIEGEELISITRFVSESKSDTSLCSITTEVGFENFKCELVSFREFKSVKESLPLYREDDKSIEHFKVASLIILVIFTLLFIYNKSLLVLAIRKSYSTNVAVADRDYSMLKDQASLVYIFFFSILFGLILQSHDSNIQISSLLQGSYNWLVLVASVLLFLLLKFLLIIVSAGLYGLNYMPKRQLIDNINILLPFVLILWLSSLFSFYGFEGFWVSLLWNLIFQSVLFLPFGIFMLRLLSNSNSPKISIISYLCATELIPAVLLVVWFFK